MIISKEAVEALYRKEGWPKITDPSLGINPLDVESQAREVARWAFDQLRERDKLIVDLVEHEGAEGFSEGTNEALKRWAEGVKFDA